MPHYKKVFDIGTYTGNGTQYRVGIPTLSGVGPTGTQVAQSLRFRASNSNYLTRTPASSGNRKTWTYSCWFKKTANGGNVGLFSVYGSSSDTNAGGVVFGSSDQIYFMAWSTIWRRTTVAFKDPSRWYHLVIAFDTTQATAANRVKMYIDGRQVDSFAASSDPALNTDYGFNTNNHHEFGAWIPTATSGYSYLDMYLAETYFLDGYAYDASYFGERNSDGIWVPKAYTGSYGTNGFYLKFAPGAAGTDSSGNGNTWTLSGHNVTTANTTYDIMTDSPTDYLSGSMSTANNAGNYCVINRNDTYATAGSWSVTNGGLYLTSSATLGVVRGTLGFSSGKWYWEVKYINGNSSEIAGISTPTSTSAGGSSGGIGYYVNGSIYVNGSASAYGTSVSAGDIIGVAVDMDNGKIWFSRNGTWQNSGDPAAGTNPGTTGLSGTYYPGFEDAASGTNATFEANFGQRAFTYTPPTGFKALNTYNIPRPADSSLWFYGDTPDLMWIKNRSASASLCVFDTVRGSALVLYGNATSADSGPSILPEMNKFGMTVINDAGNTGTNGSTNNFVYWTWKAGSNTSSTSVTNTDGTITSQVSANRQAGFSIVSWTGTGASSASVGHGLGTGTPNFVIIKKRNVSEGWYVCHSSSGQGINYAYHLFLNTTGALVGSNDPYLLGSQSNDNKLYLADGTASNGGNQSGTNYIAYCWTAIPGYSAFGSLTGNGSTDGPFVYLGFRPRFLLIKRTDGGAQSWWILDSACDTYNVVSKGLNTDQPSAESSGNTWADFLSNGFKIRTTSIGVNTSGGTYIYAAFAETPFKFARGR